MPTLIADCDRVLDGRITSGPNTYRACLLEGIQFADDASKVVCWAMRAHEQELREPRGLIEEAISLLQGLLKNLPPTDPPTVSLVWNRNEN